MTAVLIVAFCILGSGLVIGLIVWAVQAEKKRVAGMRDFADGLGLEFFESGQNELLTRLGRFQLFNSGRGRVMRNLILGKTEIASIAIFDYRYTTGSGKNQSTHNQTVVSMESDSLDIPDFTMRPENVFDRVGSALGFQDIDFDDHPEFSKSFVLKGPDEAAIREFFDSTILDFFAAKKGICFEATKGMFIYYRAAKPQSADGLRNYLEEGYSTYQAFVERLSR
ncbi:MAG: hypothetical protein H6823_10335 [Planctomycetaceae bacterium]|nr:hypothetical protein [Planctomycetaceae bacterium]